MSKPIAIFFGSTTGNTEASAEAIRDAFGEDMVDLYDVASDPLEVAESYDRIIFGVPTWDFGGMEDNWEAVWDDLTALTLDGKKVAFFGQGDQNGFGEWYLDAMGDIYRVVIESGAEVVGFWSVEGYSFVTSQALTEDKTQFVGLALDEDNEEHLSDERITAWCDQVLEEFDLAEVKQVMSA